MCHDDRSTALCTPCSCAESQLQHRIYRGGINTGVFGSFKAPKLAGIKAGKTETKTLSL